MRYRLSARATTALCLVVTMTFACAAGCDKCAYFIKQEFALPKPWGSKDIEHSCVLKQEAGRTPVADAFRHALVQEAAVELQLPLPTKWAARTTSRPQSWAPSRAPSPSCATRTLRPRAYVHVQ